MAAQWIFGRKTVSPIPSSISELGIHHNWKMITIPKPKEAREARVLLRARKFRCDMYVYIYTLSRECTTRLYHAKSFGLFAKPVPTVNGFKVPIALDVCQSNEKNYPPTSSATKELHVPFQGGDRGRWWEPQTSVHSLHVYVPPCWRIHTLSRECTTRLYHAKSFGLFAKPVPTVNGFKVPIALDVCQSNEKNYPPTSSATKELHVPFHASLPGLQRKKVC